jgi:PAS domain S-box-containing protein
MRLSSRLTAAMVALVLLAVTAVGWLTYRGIETATLPGEFQRVQAHVHLLATELQSHVRSARADAITLRSAVALRGALRAPVAEVAPVERVAGGLTAVQSGDRLAARFGAELLVKPAYLAFRLVGIAEGGREIVRVDRGGANGSVRRAPEEELKRLGERDLLRAAIALTDDEAYVSSIELDAEAGAAGAAHVPVLNVASMVPTPDGSPFGIVTIAVDLRPVFALIRAAMRNGEKVYVVNENGDYLVHPDRTREFGFAFGRRVRWQDEFPALAAALGTSEEGAHVVRDGTGETVGAAMAVVELAEGRRIGVIETVPYAELMAPAIAVRQSSLIVGGVAILVAFLLAVVFARSLTRPLVQMTGAVEAFARGAPMEVPVNASGEIGVLARAFARMAGEVREKTTALEQEIEQRRRTEAALAQSEAKFRSLFSGNPMPMWAFDRETLRFVEVNEAAIRKYGYSRSEFEQMRAVDIRPIEDVPDFLARRSSSRIHDRHSGEWRHVLRGGRIIDVDVTAHDMELDGRPVTVVVVHDITESKKAQEALRESEQLAHGIIDTALDAFVQMDEAGGILEWNPQAEKIFGWTRQEVLGRELAMLIMPEGQRKRYHERLAGFLQGGDGPVFGMRIAFAALRRDGREIQVELALTALRRRSGCVFNGFIRDLTDKIAAEEQLRQAQKLESVGQLTGGVAHDFNNILTVITGTIDILANAVADRPQLAAIARMIDEAAQRGAELTRRLLAFARKQPLQPRETDINALVIDTARLLRPSLGEQAEIESMLEADLWPAHVDPSQLSTALINLALNARDAMPEGGKLTLETGNVLLDEAYTEANAEAQPGPYVMIAVRDTGVGIPAAIREKVFEPFFTTKDVGKGTGLGLSMVYGFVRQSGGHIRIYSEVGRGTAIKLYLPRAQGEAAGAGEAAHAGPAVGGRESILVVEDDALVRGYVITQLQSLGYVTRAAANAAEALQIIAQGEHFDLLFTDVVMPGGINGRQLADEVMRLRPSVKVLFTSGYSEDAIVHHGRLDPGVALLNKPYRKTDLARKIREVLDEGRMPRAVAS